MKKLFISIFTIIILTLGTIATMEFIKNKNSNEKIARFIDFCKYKPNELHEIEREFYDLFPEGMNLSKVEKTLSTKLTKRTMPTSRTPYLANQNPPLHLVWFIAVAKCDSNSQLGLQITFFLNSNNSIVKRQINAVLDFADEKDLDSYISYNIPLNIDRFTYKGLDLILNRLFKGKTIDEVDKVMTAAGAVKKGSIKEDRLGYHYYYSYKRKSLYHEAGGAYLFAGLNFYINDEKKVYVVYQNEIFKLFEEISQKQK